MDPYTPERRIAARRIADLPFGEPERRILSDRRTLIVAEPAPSEAPPESFLDRVEDRIESLWPFGKEEPSSVPEPVRSSHTTVANADGTITTTHTAVDPARAARLNSDGTPAHNPDGTIDVV